MGAPVMLAPKTFFGHQAEIKAIESALGSGSFVLLLGPGGAGKTRLAQSVSAKEPEPLFCDFSTASSKGEVVRVVASALKISIGTGKTEVASEQIWHALHARAGTLVVFDNLETVGDGTEVITSWLDSGPRFLGTSRTKLGAPGEVVIEIGPLDTAEGVSLFVDRARAVAPEFVADEATQELVRRLHGSPLAIELASARSHVLSPRALLERFAGHIDLLKSSAPGLAERHRSLRAVVMGSWALCDEADRRALAAASVFVGGFDLEAAEAVIGADAPDRLESLIASSLVIRAAAGAGGLRFMLYESVREFASERLAEDPANLHRVRRAHADHYGALAVDIEERASNAEREALQTIFTESGNLLAAFRVNGRHALAFNPVLSRLLPADLEIADLEQARDGGASLGDVDRVEIELALVRACRRRGGTTRGLEQAKRAMEMAKRSQVAKLVADAQYMLAVVHLDAGENAAAIESAEQAIALGEQCGAIGTTARAYGHLGFALLAAGDAARASQCADSVLAIARQHGFGLLECFAENLLGAVHGSRGELGPSQQHLERSLSLARRTGHRLQEAIVVGNLAKVLMLRGDVAPARLLLEEACGLARLEGSRQVEIPQLTNLAMVDADDGRLADARARAAHAERFANEVQHHRQVVQTAMLLGTIALEEHRLDEAMADFERARVKATSLNIAVSVAVATAGLAAQAALAGSFQVGLELVERARAAAATDDAMTLAIVDARHAVVLASWASHAEREGEHALAIARFHDASELLARIAPLADISVELRIALRLTRSTLAEVDARLHVASSAPAPTFAIVRREGVFSGEQLPSDADLGFDAIERLAVIDGQLRIDLRRKPVAARLLEVVLAEPAASFDKARLYRDVWYGEFRTQSQGAAVYKAVDRLAKLLDPEPRRFLRWDEAGALVLVAKQPALLRTS